MVVTNCLSIHKLFASGYVWTYKKGGLTLTLLLYTREQQSIVNSNRDMIRWLGGKDQKQSNATLLLQIKRLMLKMIYLVSLWSPEAHWVENILSRVIFALLLSAAVFFNQSYMLESDTQCLQVCHSLTA